MDSWLLGCRMSPLLIFGITSKSKKVVCEEEKELWMRLSPDKSSNTQKVGCALEL